MSERARAEKLDGGWGVAATEYVREVRVGNADLDPAIGLYKHARRHPYLVGLHAAIHFWADFVI